MKRFICLLFVLSFLCVPAQSRVVKLGRNNRYPTAISQSSQLAQIAKDCDANCINCDRSTGLCLKCEANRYISDQFCLICPEKNYCDGQKAIPNCTGVVCLDNAVAQPTQAGCCCIKK